MNRIRWKTHLLPTLMLFTSLCFFLPGAGAQAAQDRQQAAGAEKPVAVWQSPAKLRRMAGGEKGDVIIGLSGIKFQTRKGRTLHWSFLDIQAFSLSPHSLTIKTYQDRKKHLPGIERFRFHLDRAVPPEVAAELAGEVQRPSQNAVPNPSTQGIVVPAHHRTRIGGTNGELRFREGGIDYVTRAGTDSRSWRWTDLQTVSQPDPYHLFVFGYRDTYTFDLKKPLPRSLFNHVTDEIWTHNGSEGSGDPVAPTPGTMVNGRRRGDE